MIIFLRLFSDPINKMHKCVLMDTRRDIHPPSEEGELAEKEVQFSYNADGYIAVTKEK